MLLSQVFLLFFFLSEEFIPQTFHKTCVSFYTRVLFLISRVFPVLFCPRNSEDVQSINPVLNLARLKTSVIPGTDNNPQPLLISSFTLDVCDRSSLLGFLLLLPAEGLMSGFPPPLYVIFLQPRWRESVLRCDDVSQFSGKRNPRRTTPRVIFTTVQLNFI